MSGLKSCMFVFLFFVSSSGVFAQTTEKCKWINQFNEWITIDSLSILPASVKVAGIDSSQLSIDYNLSEGTVFVRTKLSIDSAYVCYQTLPVSFHKRYYKRSLIVYDSNAIFNDPVTTDNSFLKRETLFETEDLNKSGSISRGVSFGNNQDVFVNSTLNLNLDGKLTDDLKIRASITDQNVPFQPEGNTQQLQDFDNVFIEIYNDNVSLIGGDVVLQDRSSHFLKYYKNVQGGAAKLNYALSEKDTASTSVGISVAKGRFASVQLSAREGLLGPYQIPGPDNERFVIVLANSERVFLDGQQLERGFNNDYVIDYNTAQITFTNQVLITQFSRIRIDYEFSDQDYNRTITVGKHEHEIGKLKLNVSAYSEKDNRNRPLLVDLNNNDKLLLSEIGDSLSLAVKLSADSVGFSQDQILYKMIDTVNNAGQSEVIFKYSTHPDSAYYSVIYSDVGLGNGNYTQLRTTANGRVFQWVSPIAGIPQGNFEPVIDIPVPDKKQMVAINGTYQVTKYETVSSEVAFSDQDVNLFASGGDQDNTGYAFKVGVRSDGREVAFLPDYSLILFANFEFDNENFRPIDRFRQIEYDRNWSYSPSVNQKSVSDNIFNVGFSLNKDANNNFAYQYSKRYRESDVEGYQHNLNLYKRIYNFQLNANAFYLDNDLSSTQSIWKRFSTDVSYINKYLIPGFQYNLDQNKIKNKAADSVTNSFMYFDEQVYYLKNAPQSDWDFLLRHAVRTDKRPESGELVNFTKSNTSQLTVGKQLGNDQLEVLFTYRTIDQLTINEDEEVVSGRVNWIGNMLNEHVRSNLTYAISNSQELRREFVFIKVPTGDGTHTWRDNNEDGVQDLSEFFEAINLDERNYAKIFVPTNDFVTAFQTLFNYNISIDAPRKWRTNGGILKLLSKFSNNTNWSADTKTTDDALDKRLWSFAQSIENENLIAETNSLRTTLFFNRAHPKYGLDFTYIDTERKQLLVNGFESTLNTSYEINLRYNLNKTLTLKTNITTGFKESASNFLVGRNYLIDSDLINPEVAWQPNGSMRISIQYNYMEKRNNVTENSSESAFFNEIIGELRINKAVKSSFNAQLKWADISFSGEENTPIGYDLLNALKPGKNITWSVNWQQRILSGLQLNLSYDGRKSENTDAIHTGRVQISALF